MLQIHKFNESEKIGDIIVSKNEKESAELNYTLSQVVIGQFSQPEMTSCISMTNTSLAFLVICCLLAGFVAATVVYFILWQFYLKPKYENSSSGSWAMKERPLDRNQALKKDKILCEQCMKHVHSQNGHHSQQQRSAFNNNYSYGPGLINDVKNDPHKVKSRDDSSTIVILKGSTTHGLGFNIYPDSEHKIYVRSPVLVHADQLSHGDRIINAKISFERILYEDALTILNYASPYPMELEISKSGGSKVNQENNDEEEEEIGSFIDCYLPNIIDRYSSANPINSGSSCRFKSKSWENLHISSTATEKFAYKKCASENDCYHSRSINNSGEFFPTDPGGDPMQSFDQSESSYPISNGRVNHHHVTRDDENHVINRSRMNFVKSKSEEDFRKFHQKISIENHMIQFRRFNPYPTDSDSYPDSNDQYQRYHLADQRYPANQRYPSQRDSGLGDSHTTSDFTRMNKLQYEKLMYFQDQLVLQQHDLKAMNLMVPDVPKLPENLHINNCNDD